MVKFFASTEHSSCVQTIAVQEVVVLY